MKQARTESGAPLIAHLVAPVWDGSVVHAEPVLFVKAEGQEPASARLLFSPTRVLRVASATGETSFDEGRDFRIMPELRQITLLPGSRIPFKLLSDLGRKVESSRLPEGRTRGMTGLFWGEGRTYHDLQVEVTYEHNETWHGARPSFQGVNLPHVQRILAEKSRLRLVTLGDGITAGMNASAVINAPPHRLPFPGLVATALRQATGADVTLVNLGRAGQDSAWGLQQVSVAAQQSPDLLIIAFGMADAGRTMDTVFQRNLSGIIERVKASRSETESILVTPIPPNPDWLDAAPPEVFARYTARCREISRSGTVTADVTQMWTSILQRKRYHDLTGNGLNTPNDFGHRLYAQVILSTILRGSEHE